MYANLLRQTGSFGFPDLRLAVVRKVVILQVSPSLYNLSVCFASRFSPSAIVSSQFNMNLSLVLFPLFPPSASFFPPLSSSSSLASLSFSLFPSGLLHLFLLSIACANHWMTIPWKVSGGACCACTRSSLARASARCAAGAPLWGLGRRVAMRRGRLAESGSEEWRPVRWHS